MLFTKRAATVVIFVSCLSASVVCQTAGAQLLNYDFKIVTDVKALPTPVLKRFQEKGGSRLLMANPGKRFNPGDVVWKYSPPQRRLIFAGISGNNCFVHYEQGGRGLSYILEVFALDSADPMKPIWAGYCKRAGNLEELRSQVQSGHCRQLAH